MMPRGDWIDTGSGHIAVSLFVFSVGVAMLRYKMPEGKEVIVGALASLWTAIRPGGSRAE